MRKSITNLIYYADELLDLSSMRNSFSIALQEFIDGAKNHLLALKKLDEPLWDNSNNSYKKIRFDNIR